MNTVYFTGMSNGGQTGYRLQDRLAFEVPKKAGYKDLVNLEKAFTELKRRVVK